MRQCDWCQEMGNLVLAVNHDPTSSQESDWVCSVCANLKYSEHLEELMGNPLGFIPVKHRKVSMTVCLNERCA